MIESNSASSSENDVSIRHWISGCPERISRHASTPLPSGSRTSRMATSGLVGGTRISACSTVEASPTTSRSSSPSSSSRSPRRTISWSSSRNTRVVTGTSLHTQLCLFGDEDRLAQRHQAVLVEHLDAGDLAVVPPDGPPTREDGDGLHQLGRRRDVSDLAPPNLGI